MPRISWRPSRGETPLDLSNPPTSDITGIIVPPRRDKPLEIVGHCPHCGAPIYGKKQLEGEPEIRYACECRLRYGPSETK